MPPGPGHCAVLNTAVLVISPSNGGTFGKWLGPKRVGMIRRAAVAGTIQPIHAVAGLHEIMHPAGTSADPHHVRALPASAVHHHHRIRMALLGRNHVLHVHLPLRDGRRTPFSCAARPPRSSPDRRASARSIPCCDLDRCRLTTAGAPLATLASIQSRTGCSASRLFFASMHHGAVAYGHASGMFGSGADVQPCPAGAAPRPRCPSPDSDAPAPSPMRRPRRRRA